ncbi:hypothetical protein B5F76_01490 [Desulfovibrio sp. An276]|uniref:vWA domain-containing protein n=1 Tax=Desulfovibrio sp. An276 TaxID=1965618 RepID=UPI000B3ACFBE|nr:vWA domain-containing protein [Desulfovibrio sp. An276]OUO55309.1 hypothetical protein B5F76_01490 [Desulfovibrio sp. An276]
MNRTKDIGQALPLVASMLGDKLGVKVQTRGFDTACTDGDTIYIPPLPMDGEEEMLGLINGYIDHEAAHIRFTDFQAVKAANLSPTGFFIWNAIEDWRIEHELVKRYPGCRRHFDWLIRHMFMEQGKDGEMPSFPVLNYILLTLRSWDVPDLLAQCDKYAAVISGLWGSLKKDLDAILEDIPDHCRSTHDSISFTHRILHLLEQKSKEEHFAPNHNNSAQHSDSKDNASRRKQEAIHTSASNHQTDPPSTHSSTISNDSTTPSSSNTTPANPDSDKSQGENLLKQCLEATADELPENLDEKLSAQLTANANTTHGMRLAVVSPTQTTPLPDALLKETQTTSRAMGMKLQALLQAQTLKRNSLGRRGRTDGHHLYRLATANPRVFLQSNPVEDTDTAVHILLDSSASMSSDMELATAACYAVATALTRIPGLNVGITTFPGQQTADLLPTVFPLKRHGKRLRPMNVQASGSTPLAEALCWVATQMVPLKEKRKLILLITDGEPDDHILATKAIQRLQASNFEIGGIGIQSRVLGGFLPSSSETITSLSELAPALYRILHKQLVTRR